MFHKTGIKGVVRFLVVAALYCCCQVCAFSQTGESVDLGKPRIWTATTGHKLEATYVGREGNKIRLSLNDGKERTIMLENLSEADQLLLAGGTSTESSERKATAPNVAKGGKTHPYLEFLDEAKQKRLGREEGVAYYQNVVAVLYKQIQEYEFKYPKDFIKEDNSFNTKYLTKIVEKKKAVSQRKNLFTGEYMATPVYANEPQWHSVSQEVRYSLSGSTFNIEQCDILYAGNNEKKVRFSVWLDKKALNEAKFNAMYSEEGKNYFYTLHTWVEPSTNDSLVMGGTRDGWVRCCSHDIRKGMFYTLVILIDRDGKVTIKNSEEGSFLFSATAPSKKDFFYPRTYFDSVYYFVRDTEKLILGRYDLNGTSMPLENLWAESTRKNSGVSTKPSAKHDDPLNVFAERHIKDK